MTENEKNILEILREIKEGIPDDINVNLLDNGFIDSFDIVNIVAKLEEVFNVEVDSGNIIPENFKTISTMAKMMTIKE